MYATEINTSVHVRIKVYTIYVEQFTSEVIERCNSINIRVILLIKSIFLKKKEKGRKTMWL